MKKKVSRNMQGTLYGVGVGPGDWELLTLKALRIIKEADIIAVPETEDKETTALNIVSQALDLSDREIIRIYMPMTRDENKLDESHNNGAKEITELLEKGKNVAFLTLGDPTIYSTYAYLHNRVLKSGYNAQFVPGVPSFCAAAAKLNISLCEGGEPLHIIPASYKDAAEFLDWQGTKVLMKSGKEFGKVRNEIRKKNLIKNSSMVERCGMESEKVYKNINDAEEKTSYFSIIVVKEEENY
jgi:precorrin-2/cobalt-factor-2 C20-methyltransferase